MRLTIKNNHHMLFGGILKSYSYIPEPGPGLGARLVAGLLAGGVAFGLRPSGTSSGPIGRRVRGVPRVPRLMGVAVLERGRPGPRLTNEAGGVPMGFVSPVKVAGVSGKKQIKL